MSAGVATRSRMPFSVGSPPACVRVFPHAFIRFGRAKYGCRVAFEESAKCSRSGNGGFCFTSLSPSCRIRGRHSRRATSRVTKRKYRSLSDARSATSVIEQPIDAAGKTISDVDHASVAAVDCAIELSVIIDAVDYFPSTSTSLENGMLSDKGNRLNLITNLSNVSPRQATFSPVESGIGNPNSTLEAKRNSLESLQKQLRSLTGGKGKSERRGFGGKAIARGAGIQLPDNIEAVLPVNPDKDPAEYLFLYGKLLGAGRLQDCVSILENMNEHSILNMDKVNPYEFYSACKKTRALKEAFRFSRLVGRKLLRNYSMLLSVCAQAQDASAACRVLEMVRNAGLKADCIFYTTLISACAKAGRIDLMFKFVAVPQ